MQCHLSHEISLVLLSGVFSLRSTFHLCDCPYDSTPVGQSGQSSSDLPLFFHLLFDCVGHTLRPLACQPTVTQMRTAETNANIALITPLGYLCNWTASLKDSVLKGTVQPKWKLYFFAPLNVASFLCGKQQGDFLKNTLGILFKMMKVNGECGCQAPNKREERGKKVSRNDLYDLWTIECISECHLFWHFCH